MPPPTLVLASGSPRRLELLATLGLHPVVRPPNVDEARHPDEGPGRYVTRLAALKAGASVGPGEVALGADTVVVLALVRIKLEVRLGEPSARVLAPSKSRLC